MPENRIESCFQANVVAGAGAVLPYFTSGFPDLGTTAELIRCADGLGVPVVEIGVPYSDSIADGPVIQGSFHQVLSRGQTVQDTMDLAALVRPSVRCALIVMVSYGIVYRFGAAAFAKRAASAGFDGIILPDVPVEESPSVSALFRRAGLCYIGLVAPTTSPGRREKIAAASTGFVYLMAVAGITGERRELPPGLSGEVARLREVSGLPVCVGFGVSTADHVRAVCDFADGAIVGSAIIRRIGDAVRQGMTPELIVKSVEHFLAQLISGGTGEPSS